RRLGTAGLAFFASRSWIARNGVPAGGLAGCEVILPAESAMRLPMFAAAAGIAEHSRLVLRTGDILTSMAAAVAGIGIALLPCMLGMRHAELVAVPPGLVATTDQYLVSHRDL